MNLVSPKDSASIEEISTNTKRSARSNNPCATLILNLSALCFEYETRIEDVPARKASLQSYTPKQKNSKDSTILSLTASKYSPKLDTNLVLLARAPSNKSNNAEIKNNARPRTLLIVKKTITANNPVKSPRRVRWLGLNPTAAMGSIMNSVMGLTPFLSFELTINHVNVGL